VKTLRFETLSSPSPVSGHPLYAGEDYAFNFRMDLREKENRVGKHGTTSFVVGTLQLEVAVDNPFCLYVWGYCPMGRWERSSLSPPMAQRGSLRASYEKSLISGVSVGIEEMMPANYWFDPDSGWFCAGTTEAASPGAQAVEFASGCLAVVADGRLLSLWVHPENWEEVAGKFSSAR
jgi:hypothetical protein